MSRVAVIMAGGSGTRLWPLSRRSRPKQLLRIIEGKSLLRLAYERLRRVLSDEAIHVIALEEHLDAIAAEVPEIGRENLIGEPTGRDTANAVALAASIVHHRRGPCTMGVFTADHVIRPVERFGAALERAFAAAEAHGDALITFGIRPSEPHTGYGYLQRGAAQGEGVWSVEQFKEKPDLATAQRYLSSGVHFWNSGMFVWRTPTILDLLARLVPRAHEMGAKLGGIWGTEAGRQWARSVYPTLDRVSIDVAVMEKAPRVLMVEMDASWMDVGSWTALASVIGADAGGNTVSGARFVQVDSTNNVVVAEDGHTVAAIGVNDLVVVHSADATLVCRKDEAQRIKQLMDQVGSDLQ